MTQTRKAIEEDRLKVIEDYSFSWDRIPSESIARFELFEEFLKLGRTRTYRKIADLCGRSDTNISVISSQFSWRDRADNYDQMKDEEMRVKLDSEILQSRIRQQALGGEMQKLAEKGLEILNEIPEDLSPQDISRLIDVGTKIENLALGAPTAISESNVKSEVKVQVEEVDPEISKEIGKLIAIKASQQMEINV
jgi:hypothetical protein